MIYLDGAATTPILPCVKKAMFEAISEYSGNPSSLHSAGTLSRKKIEEVRKKVADFINASPEEIIFTSGATEGNNTVFHTFSEKTVLISPYEHPSVYEPAKFYSKSLKITDFATNPIISSEIPTLISHQLANNETGHIFDIKNLAKKAKTLSPRTYFHADATQAIGKIKIDVKSLNVDYLTFSAHKFGGPEGIGVLYANSTAPISPLILGGNQEQGRRAGTLPTFLIVGLGAAIDYLLENDIFSLYETKIRPLKNLLAREIQSKIPNSIQNSPLDATSSLPELLNFSFPGAEGESVQLRLDLEAEIEVGTGSACASGEPSRTLLALSGDPELAHSSIRFSLNPETTEKDIQKIMDYLPKIIKTLRDISTYPEKERK